MKYSVRVFYENKQECPFQPSTKAEGCIWETRYLRWLDVNREYPIKVGQKGGRTSWGMADNVRHAESFDRLISWSLCVTPLLWIFFVFSHRQSRWNTTGKCSLVAVKMSCLKHLNVFVHIMYIVDTQAVNVSDKSALLDCLANSA